MMATASSAHTLTEGPTVGAGFGRRQVHAVAACYFVASFAALGLPPYLTQILPELGDGAARWAGLLYVVPTVLAELLAALADLHPHTEPALWSDVRATVQEFADTHGCPPRLSALLAGVPLPAKANLLTRWERKADRDAGYVRLTSPFPLAEHVRDLGARTDAPWSTAG